MMKFKKIILTTVSLVSLPLTILTFNDLKVNGNTLIKATTINKVNLKHVNIVGNKSYINSGYNSVTAKLTNTSIFEKNKDNITINNKVTHFENNALSYESLSKILNPQNSQEKYSFLKEDVVTSLTNEYDDYKSLKPLKIYYYFNEEEKISESNIVKQKIKSSAQDESNNNPNKFFQDYGDEFIAACNLNIVGGVEINIMPSSNKALTQLKNNFWNSKNDDNRKLDQLGQNNWNKLSGTDDDVFSIDVKGFSIGLNRNNKISFIKNLNNLSINDSSSTMINKSFKEINKLVKQGYEQLRDQKNILDVEDYGKINIDNLLVNSFIRYNYGAVRLPFKNLSDLNYLNQCQNAYDKYRELKKDIVLMYSNENKIDRNFKKYLFKNYNNQNSSVEDYLNAIGSLFRKHSDWFVAGQRTTKNYLIINAINSHLNQIAQNIWLKKLDFILRFQLSFSDKEYLSDSNFFVTLVPIPLDINTLNGKSDHYSSCQLFLSYNNIPAEIKFKFNNIDLNLTDSYVIPNYNDVWNDSQEFKVSIGMSNSTTSIENNNIEKTFNYVGIDSSRTNGIMFIGDEKSNSEYVKSKILWCGKKFNTTFINDGFQKRNSMSYCNFTDMFDVTSNWK